MFRPRDFQQLPKLLRFIIFVLFFASLFCAFVYGVAQHILHSSANDPQIQIAEDAARSQEKGALLGSLVSSEPVEISQSLSTFYMVYDNNKNLKSSSILLNGQVPQYPKGVLDYAAKHGEDLVTWQPAPGVRIASVVVPYQGLNPGFVVVGRSMREVEKREVHIFLATFFAWAVAVLGSLVLGIYLIKE